MKKPVLQNIPLRTETGRRVAEALREQAQPLDVDFSALEMRALAQIQPCNCGTSKLFGYRHADSCPHKAVFG